MLKAYRARWIDYKFSSWKSLSKVIVAVAHKFQSKALWYKRSKALSSGTIAFDDISVVVKCLTVSLSDLWSKYCSNRPVCISYIQLHALLLPLLQSRSKLLHENRHIHGLLKLEIISILLMILYLVLRHIYIWVVDYLVQYDISLISSVAAHQKIWTSNQLIDCSDSELAHVLTKLLCYEQHEVLHVLWLSSESLSEFWVLSCYTDRTCVKVTYSHHDTSHSYKRRCCKSKFLCAEHCSYSNVTACHQLTVCLKDNLVSEIIHDKCLMCLCKSELPRKSCIVNWVVRCCTCSTVVTWDQDDLCSSLCNTGSYCTNTGLGHKFYWYSRITVCVLAVVDELCKILYRIDIVVWWWGDKAYTRCWKSCLCDPWIYLSARKMSALARLCSLCHLDLYLLGTHKISRCDTKSSWCNLLDGWASVLAILSDRKSLYRLTALSWIGLAAQLIHSDGHTLMCLLWYTSVTHGTCLESLHDLTCRLNLIKWNRLISKLEVHKASQVEWLLLVMERCCVLLKHLVVAAPCSLLKKMYSNRIVQVLLLAASELVCTDACEGKVCVQAKRIKCWWVKIINGLLKLFYTRTTYTAYCICKVSVHNVLWKTDTLKYLWTHVWLYSWYTHLGCDLYYSVTYCTVVIIDSRIEILVQQMWIYHLLDRLYCKIWIDCTCTVSEKCCKVMNISWISTLKDDRNRCSLLCTYQMLLHSWHCKKWWDCHMVLVNAPVWENEYIYTISVELIGLDEESVQSLLHGCVLIIKNRKCRNLKSRYIHILDLQKICICQYWMVDLQHMAVLRLLFKDVAVLSEIYRCGCDNFLSDRIDRRICNLCK